MPINADAYTPNAANTQWTLRSNGQAALGAHAANHAEIGAYNNAPAGHGVYLIEIDAYPCNACHMFFRNATGNGAVSIVVSISANQGAYSADHGFGLNGSVPCIIYYHNGAARYNSITHAMQGINGPPAGFPAIPPLPL